MCATIQKGICGAKLYSCLFLSVMFFAAASASAADFLPGKNLFRPFMADPTQPSYNVKLTGPVGGGRLAEINMGDELGLAAWEMPSGKLQLGIMGGVAARFDISRVTNDFQIADFSLAFPLDYKTGPWELRAMYWHTSSHLGDDYVKSHDLQPSTLQKHVTDDFRLLAAYRVSEQLRVYGGGAYAFNIIPSEAGRHMLHGGGEYFFGQQEQKTRPFLAADLQSWQRVSWKPSFTARAGVRTKGQQQALSAYVEFFSGQLLYLGLMPQTETHWALGFNFEL